MRRGGGNGKRRRAAALQGAFGAGAGTGAAEKNLEII